MPKYEIKERGSNTVVKSVRGTWADVLAVLYEEQQKEPKRDLKVDVNYKENDEDGV